MTEDKQKKVEKLDVETDQDRQERLGELSKEEAIADDEDPCLRP